jgi:hypothetical protein
VDLLLKMIPAEIVTLYVFVIKLAPLLSGKTATALPAAWNTVKIWSPEFWVTWIIFGVSLILTPIALAVQDPKPNEPNGAALGGSGSGSLQGRFHYGRTPRVASICLDYRITIYSPSSWLPFMR